MFKLNRINHKANKLHESILNKALKGITIGTLSLGMLGGVSVANNIMNNNVVHAYSFEAKSDVAGNIATSKFDEASNNRLAPYAARDAEKYGPSDADSWEDNDPDLFAKYAPQIASHWTLHQKKDFYNLTGVNIDDITPSHPVKEVSDSDLNVDPNYIPKPKKHNHQRKPKITKPNKHKNKVRHHNSRRATRNKKAHKHYFHKKLNKSHKAKSNRRAKRLTKKQLNHINGLIKKNNKDLKSKKAKHNYKYRKALLKKNQSLKKLLKSRK